MAVAYINRYAAYVVHISRDKNYINDESLSNIAECGMEFKHDEVKNCFIFQPTMRWKKLWLVLM